MTKGGIPHGVDIRCYRRSVSKSQKSLQESIEAIDREKTEEVVETAKNAFDEFAKDKSNLEKAVHERLREIEDDQEITDSSKIEELEKVLFDEIDQLKDFYLLAKSKVNCSLRLNGDGTERRNCSGSVRTGLSSGSSTDTVVSALAVAGPKLPDTPIPVFKGDITTFSDWRNLFEKLIHVNGRLDPVAKMNFLQRAMQGDVAGLVDNYGTSEKAYDEAWAYLNSRFNNRRAIIGALYNKLMNLERINEPNGIRSLLDKCDSIVRGLKINNAQSEEMSQFLCFYISQKLDEKTRFEFENSITDNDSYPAYQTLASFLQNRSFAQETINRVMKEGCKANAATKFISSGGKQSVKRTMLSTSRAIKCACCGLDHQIYNCDEFGKKSVEERRNVVREKRLCLVCLRPGHLASRCGSKVRCTRCQGRHHVLIHQGYYLKPDATEVKGLDADKEKSSSNSAQESIDSVEKKTMCTVCESSVTLLPTAIVKVKSGDMRIPARALLDQCSEACLISEEFLARCKLPLMTANVVISGITEDRKKSSYEVYVAIQSRVRDFSITIRANVLPRIPYSVKLSAMKDLALALPNFQWADTDLDRSEVDILIGGDYYEKILLDEREWYGDLCLRGSLFGWLTSGPLPSRKNKVKQCNLATLALESQLEKFWLVEEVVESRSTTAEQEDCVHHFESTVRRAQDGKFIVRYPFKGEKSSVLNTYFRALNSLYRMEKKLNSELRKMYVEFMQEYRRMGHMVPVQENLATTEYFIPHQAVLRPDSSTTPLRVVFNASARAQGGKSLNDILMTGPVLQPELFDTIIKWRQHPIAFTADISKMYRRIEADEKDRSMQRILWRDSVDDPVQVYELTTLTYGTAPASFMATACLQKLAEELPQKDRKVAEALRSHFYMDDLMTGDESFEGAVELYKGLHSVLLSANFPLRKYSSNSEELMRSIDPELWSKKDAVGIELKESISILGLSWLPDQDLLQIKCNVGGVDVVTGRSILSSISRVFDPMGFCVPVTITGKLIMQRVWQERLSWDSQVSELLAAEFREYLSKLAEVNELKIPRHLCVWQSSVRTLFGFCDASPKACCAVVYLHVTNGSEKHVSFVCAKSRVAPLKTMTIPRLELQAAKLLAKLIRRIMTVLNVSVQNTFCFSDSKIVLCWLKGPAEKFKVFVGNRITEIADSVPSSQWRYVETKSNPADLGTRGVSASALLKSGLWFEGPAFLADFQGSEEVFKVSDEDIDLEKRNEKKVFVSVVDSDEIDFTKKFSSYTRLVRSVAYVMRFISACKKNGVRKSIILEKSEIESAIIIVLRLVQSVSYREEKDRLSDGLSVKKKSALKSLCPVLNKDRLLCVGGRLDLSDFSECKKHPIIIPAKSHFAKLYVRHLHAQYFHAGRRFLAAFLCSRFWFAGGSTNVIKQVIRECVTCVRFKAETMTQIMGQIPAVRLRPSRPFTYTGVDYAGYFHTKCVGHRSTKVNRCYLAVFVCLTTRAAHLEIVSDLSTTRFIETFHRFIARRGCPGVVFSDNATNFVGAAKILSDFLRSEEVQQALTTFATSQGFEWSFIPPSTPHFGGGWEAAVKSAKHHLYRVIGKTTLTFEEYATVFCRIEAILNSRPLFVQGQHGEIVTPAHFLIGSSMLDLPEDEEKPLPLGVRYQMMRNMVKHFWNVWARDYVNQLQQRQKWTTREDNLRIGDVVIVRTENTKPATWPLGRIKAVYPGRDGAVRVADVHFQGAVKRRPIATLVRLAKES